MANWAKLQEQLTGLPVVKRDKHSIHFAKGDGQIVANFSGAPCHYEENGIWKALDTAIVELEDGSLGAKGVPVRLNLNGLVRLINENNEDLYSQVTTRVGVFNSTTRNLVDYINLPVGQVQDDLLIKDTDLYSHSLRLTETGLREEIVIKSKPAFVTDKANLWLVLDTVVTGVSFEDGWLDAFEIAQMHFPPPTATDAEGREGTAKRYAKNIGGVQHIFTGLKFSELYRAAYPVTVDPDFSGGSGYVITSQSTDYATARTTSVSSAAWSNRSDVGQGQWSVYLRTLRIFTKFDTSSIGAGSTVTQVNLAMCPYYNNSATDFDIQICMQDWSAQDPIASGNRETAFDNCLAETDYDVWLNSADCPKRQRYTGGNMTTSWINKTGTTYYSIRSSRDYNGDERVIDGNTETVNLCAPDNATESYRPVLTVTYLIPDYTLTCAAGSYSLTGTDCTLTHTPASQNLTLTCSAGSYSLTGTNADLTVKRNYVLACGAGSYSLTGSDVDFVLQRNYSLECGAGSYSLTGTDTTFEVKRNYTLVCEAGSYSLTGTNADLTVTRHYTLTCETGSYALAGTNADLILQRNYVLACSAGNYLITGTDVTLTVQRNYTLTCAAGSYSLTGTNVTLTSTVKQNLTLACSAGSYSLTGTNADLTVTRHYTLTCEAGGYALTGSIVDLTVQRNYVLVCEAGSYALTGTNAGLTSARTMALESGSYALTGTNAGLYRALVMACEAGTYALTGSDATFNANYIFALGMGSYVLVGTSVGLFVLSPTPACRTATIEFENRTFAIPHENRTLEVTCH